MTTGAVVARAAWAALALTVAPVLDASGQEKLTVERINSEPPLGGTLPSDIAWTPDARRVTWLTAGRAAGAPPDLWALEPSTGKATRLIDGARLLAPASGGGEPSPLPLRGYSWSPSGETLLVSTGGDIFLVDVRQQSVRPLVKTPEEEEFPALSPDGRHVAFVRKNDLYVVEVESGRETRLTRSGSETVLNGRLDWVYEEELGSRSGRAFAWSPDSRKIAYLQLDQARVPTFPIVDFLPVSNTLGTQRYPKPGDPNAVVRVGVVGLDPSAGPERLVSFTPDDLYIVPDLAWSQDSQTLAFQQVNREQNELQLRVLTVPESPSGLLGGPRTLLTERSPTWVNASPAPRFLKDNHRFLWVSERDGYAHVYVCDLSGSCRAVTQGPWTVDAQSSFASAGGPLFADERTGFLYFTATEKDARERHLYRARFDGTGRARLTREDGTHRVILSPDGRFYVDTFSDVTHPTSGDPFQRRWAPPDPHRREQVARDPPLRAGPGGMGGPARQGRHRRSTARS